MSKLTLLGTVHLDPMGDMRLSTALRNLQPDCVVCEFNDQQKKLTGQAEEVQQFSRFVKENNLDADYELRRCRDYCEEAGIPLIDSDITFSDDEISLLATEAIALKEAAAMMNKTPAELIEMMYGLSDEHMNMVYQQMPEDVKNIVMKPEREQRMEQQLRQCCEKYSHVVFVSGMIHTLSLSEKLADLQPVRMRLNSFLKIQR